MEGKLIIETLNQSGKGLESIELTEEFKDFAPNIPLVNRILSLERLLLRTAYPRVLNRGSLDFSSRKIRPQKHTGRARQGRLGAPHQRKGAVAHGPNGRLYDQKFNRKEYFISLLSLFLLKANLSLAFLLKNDINSLRTKDSQKLIESVSTKKKILFLFDKKEGFWNFILANRNRKNFSVLNLDDVKLNSLFKSDYFILSPLGLDYFRGILKKI